jgi:hypothetical protein
MAITEAFSGSATIGTAQYDLPTNSTSTVSAQTAKGIYQLFLDLSNLTANESYRLRIYERVLSTGSPGGTQRVVDDTTISGAQTTEPIYATAALVLMNGWTFTLTRLASAGGTDKIISWSIRQVA